MRKGIPSNYQIFEHWKEKRLGNDPVIVIDWGEPDCWACHKAILVEDEISLKNGDYRTIWNRTSGKLERCHIIPKALGGSNEVDNLFLLCKECHSDSPDTTNSELFFNWVIDKRSNCTFGVDNRELKNDIDKYCSMYNITPNELGKFVKDINFEINYDKINTHGTKVNYSTLLLHWIDEYNAYRNKEVLT